MCVWSGSDTSVCACHWGATRPLQSHPAARLSPDIPHLSSHARRLRLTLFLLPGTAPLLCPRGPAPRPLPPQSSQTPSSGVTAPRKSLWLALCARLLALGGSGPIKVAQCPWQPGQCLARSRRWETLAELTHPRVHLSQPWCGAQAGPWPHRCFSGGTECSSGRAAESPSAPKRETG